MKVHEAKYFKLCQCSMFNVQRSIFNIQTWYHSIFRVNSLPFNLILSVDSSSTKVHGQRIDNTCFPINSSISFTVLLAPSSVDRLPPYPEPNKQRLQPHHRTSSVSIVPRMDFPEIVTLLRIRGTRTISPSSPWYFPLSCHIRLLN